MFTACDVVGGAWVHVYVCISTYCCSDTDVSLEVFFVFFGEQSRKAWREVNRMNDFITKLCSQHLCVRSQLRWVQSSLTKGSWQESWIIRCDLLRCLPVVTHDVTTTRTKQWTPGVSHKARMLASEPTFRVSQRCFSFNLARSSW